MSLEQIQLALTAVNMIGTGVVWLYVYLQGRQRVTMTRIREMENDIGAQLSDHATRLTALESSVRHLPDHADIGDLHEKINQVAGGLRETKGEMTLMRRLLEDINTFLREMGR